MSLHAGGGAVGVGGEGGGYQFTLPSRQPLHGGLRGRGSKKVEGAMPRGRSPGPGGLMLTCTCSAAVAADEGTGLLVILQPPGSAQRFSCGVSRLVNP